MQIGLFYFTIILLIFMMGMLMLFWIAKYKFFNGNSAAIDDGGEYTNISNFESLMLLFVILLILAIIFFGYAWFDKKNDEEQRKENSLKLF